jgi:hypothetical protein
VSPTKTTKISFESKSQSKVAKIYDPVTKTFKEVPNKPSNPIVPVLMEPSPKHSRGKNLIVKKGQAVNSENEGAYSDQELSSAKSQGEKKGSQTSRNEPTSRMVEEISKG